MPAALNVVKAKAVQSTTATRQVAGKTVLYPASQAFDKAPATTSLTKAQLTPWLAIDLGARFEINKVRKAGRDWLLKGHALRKPLHHAPVRVTS